MPSTLLLRRTSAINSFNKLYCCQTFPASTTTTARSGRSTASRELATKRITKNSKNDTSLNSSINLLFSFDRFSYSCRNFSSTRSFKNNESDKNESTKTKTGDANDDEVLISKLRDSLKEAMRAKDLVKRDTLKSILGEIQNSQKKSNLTEPKKMIVKGLMKSSIKKRLQASKLAMESNPPRLDLHELNLKEIEILKQFVDYPSPPPSNKNPQ